MTCIEKAQKYQWNITYERDMENFFPITFEDSGMTELEFEKYLDERNGFDKNRLAAFLPRCEKFEEMLSDWNWSNLDL